MTPAAPTGWVADYFSAIMAAVTALGALATLWWTAREKAAALRRADTDARERAEQRKHDAEKEASLVRHQTEREAQQDKKADVELIRTQVQWMIDEMRKDLGNVREQLIEANKKLEQCEAHREQDWAVIVKLRDDLDAMRRRINDGGS